MSKHLSLSPQTPRRVVRTGTWQFMSANLIYPSMSARPGATHDFQDDLESSLYVLLWVALMYSDVSNPALARLFLEDTLDSKCYDNTGSVAKADFLLGASFLDKVTFTNLDRPLLQNLLKQLAGLFRYRYLTGPDELWQTLGLPDSLKEPLRESHCDAVSKLNNHAATIKLFDEALKNRSEWPSNEVPKKQIFNPSPSQLVVKSNSSTTTYRMG